MTLIRLATERDAPQIAAIYAPVVEHTVISFEEEPPSAGEMAARIAATLPTHPWLVSEAGAEIHGYAYASVLRTRAAYRWAAEMTVYVRDDRRRRGVGKALYEALLSVLAAQGHVSVYGGITLPNPGSVGLHESLGFTCVGVFPGVGYKFGAWYDVGFWQRPLGARPDAPHEPRPVSPELVERALGR